MTSEGSVIRRYVTAQRKMFMMPLGSFVVHSFVAWAMWSHSSTNCLSIKWASSQNCWYKTAKSPSFNMRVLNASTVISNQVTCTAPKSSYPNSICPFENDMLFDYRTGFCGMFANITQFELVYSTICRYKWWLVQVIGLAKFKPICT